MYIYLSASQIKDEPLLKREIYKKIKNKRNWNCQKARKDRKTSWKAVAKLWHENANAKHAFCQRLFFYEYWEFMDFHIYIPTEFFGYHPVWIDFLSNVRQSNVHSLVHCQTNSKKNVLFNFSFHSNFIHFVFSLLHSSVEIRSHVCVDNGMWDERDHILDCKKKQQ